MSYAIDVAITAALVGAVNGRVHPHMLPESGVVYPAIVYSTPGTRPDATLTGQSTLTFYRYRLDLYAATRKELGQLRNTVLAIMRRFPYKNIPVADFDGYDPTISVFRRTLDFSVSETLPKSFSRRTKDAARSPST